MSGNVSQEINGNVFKIKAHGGNRAKNLEGIAKALKENYPNDRRLRGYAEQLKIIAGELV